MAGPKYVFVFGDIAECPGCGTCRVETESINRTVRLHVADDQLGLVRNRQVPPEAADLIDIALCIHTADRLAARHRDMPSDIVCAVPLRNPEVFGRADVVAELGDLLYWYTGDNWTFDFSTRQRVGRPSEQQLHLPFPVRASDSMEIALWSGGLDSLAGLYNLLMAEANNRFLLVGTGGSTYVHRLQGDVAERAEFRFPGRTKLIRVPFRLDGCEGVQLNSELRARGLAFLLVGAATSACAAISALHVYENGVGAINLPFRASEVAWDHTRAVHPLSLLYVQHWLSLVLGEAFMIRNPFLYETKGQMCEVFQDARLVEDVALTVSCDSRRRDPGLPAQCGCCSSCLLRRQALAAAEVADSTAYLIPDRRQPSERDLRHFLAMQHQIRILGDIYAANSPWDGLYDRYPVLLDVAERIAKAEGGEADGVERCLTDLYRRYLGEWNAVETLFSGVIAAAQTDGTRQSSSRR
jgi:hypothetical protein